MKKNIIAAIVLSMTLTFTSCGIGTTTNLTSNTTAATTTATTTTTTATTAGSALGSILNSSTGSDLLSGLLSTLLSGTTTQQSLVGTWTYSAPEVRFESENLLAQAGGMVVASQVKSKMETYLTKYGFTAGKTAITLDANNNFNMQLGNIPLIGTYTYDAQTNTLNLKGAFGLTNITCTCSVVGNNMYMLFNADKIMSLMNTVSKSSSSTISSVVGQFNGMKLGWAMTK